MEDQDFNSYKKHILNPEPRDLNEKIEIKVNAKELIEEVKKKIIGQAHNDQGKAHHSDEQGQELGTYTVLHSTSSLRSMACAFALLLYFFSALGSNLYPMPQIVRIYSPFAPILLRSFLT